jgi:hypothetical protein
MLSPALQSTAEDVDLGRVPEWWLPARRGTPGDTRLDLRTGNYLY